MGDRRWATDGNLICPCVAEGPFRDPACNSLQLLPHRACELWRCHGGHGAMGLVLRLSVLSSVFSSRVHVFSPSGVKDNNNNQSMMPLSTFVPLLNTHDYGPSSPLPGRGDPGIQESRTQRNPLRRHPVVGPSLGHLSPIIAHRRPSLAHGRPSLASRPGR